MKLRFLWRAFKTRFRDCRIELSALKAHICPTDIVCDIGANKGSFILWLSKWAHKGKVVAFEPQISLVEYLVDVTKVLSLTNVIIEPKAVSSRKGKAHLYIPGGSVSPGASLCEAVADREECTISEVEVVTLDDYFSLEEKVRALKIDVEGAELDVFKGATRILEHCRPLLVFECENRHLKHGNVFDVFNFLYDFNYRGQFVAQNLLVDIAEFIPEKHQKQSGDRYWDRKEYVNNFIFRPREA